MRKFIFKDRSIKKHYILKREKNKRTLKKQIR